MSDYTDRLLGRVEPATSAQKFRAYLVDEVVKAANNLLIFDHAAIDQPMLPNWYVQARDRIDQLANGIQDGLRGS